MADIPAETLEAQAKASDPAASAWVSANAGSGKTYVLAQRVIRLLLDRVEPARILCLTFTKAAAAEMSNRIFERLGQWTTASDEWLNRELTTLLGRAPSLSERARARTLFARALDTPGGLKIQTIHAFCEALLHQFPLEANVSGHFEVMDDLRQRELLDRARQASFAEVDQTDRADFRAAYDLLLDEASDAAIGKALDEIVGKRETFTDWIAGDVAGAMAPVWRKFWLEPDVSRETLIGSMLADFPLTSADLATIAEDARMEGGKSNSDFADAVAAYVASQDPLQSFRLRNNIFLTLKGTARARLVTKAVLAGRPGLEEQLAAAAAQAERDAAGLADWRMLKASQSLFLIADTMLGRYQSFKHSEALVDFNDLIGRTRNLLARSDVRDWVRYKLDRGIDHVLVDEAQDTSPEQWEIINAVIGEFFAGEGSVTTIRTVFVVGDEKQSIFSFQGADPARFRMQEDWLERRTREADLVFHKVPLNLSFRSSLDVLGAVDRVFALAENARGLGDDSAGTVHQAIRASDPGDVRLWPLFAKAPAEERKDWLAPLDAPEPGDPAILLARRIAATVAGWIDNGEKLPGRERPIRCGDILILVRKRDRFMTAVIRELKEKGIAIAGADRLKLTEHIAIEDLMALGRAMVMPLDDLSLAAALKSPLFGVDEDELLDLCVARGGRPLWDHLAHLAETDSAIASRAREISAGLRELRAVAQGETVYGFYAHVLGRFGGRQAFLSRLGSEAEDVLDAFEEATLDHERQGHAGLEDFLAAFGAAEPEIKREIDVRRNEVRVITVHASKGLEAPIVFLVDPCSEAFVPQLAPSILSLADERGLAGYLWMLGGKGNSPVVEDAMGMIRTRTEEEYRRLLYVAMTRAADRLIVCGYRGVRGPKGDHWHKMIEDALETEATPCLDAAGEPDGFIWRHTDTAVRARMKERPSGVGTPTDLVPSTVAPPWLGVDAPSEPPLFRPLNPSTALALKGEPVTAEPEAVPDTAEAGPVVAEVAQRIGLERGTAIHRLLQVLPDIAVEDRGAAGAKWLARNLVDWDEASRDEALAEAIRLIDDPELATLFGPESRAEAGIAGNVEISGRSVTVSGQIDRMAVTEDAILLADFKTNRTVPRGPAEVPEAYRLQLALYHALVSSIWPDRQVRCLLVWTRNGSVTVLDEETLKQSLAAIAPN